VRAERFRKRPWRLVSTFGPLSLALFALRRLDIDRALERASRAIGARVAAIRLPFAEAAVDVDRAAIRPRRPHPDAPAAPRPAQRLLNASPDTT
jgi:hypothetical protein